MAALSNFLQLLFGVTLGLTILGCGTAAAAYFFFSQMVRTPARPIFPEELATEPAPETAAPAVTSDQTPAPAATPSPAPAPETLEPGAYRVRVTWADGLSLRTEPRTDADTIGGFAYDEIMIVLEQSADGEWDRVRRPGSDQEGWVRSGNAERLEDGQ